VSEHGTVAYDPIFLLLLLREIYLITILVLPSFTTFWFVTLTTSIVFILNLNIYL